jgi:hypothetical protein
VWGGYWDDHHPHSMFFAPRAGLSTSDEYIGNLDALDLASVVMTPNGEHHQACPFERVCLYSGWLKYGNRKVRYLPERVLRQFGYIQTIPGHPYESAPP